jgi:hypothetical protein
MGDLFDWILKSMEERVEAYLPKGNFRKLHKLSVGEINQALDNARKTHKPEVKFYKANYRRPFKVYHEELKEYCRDRAED